MSRAGERVGRGGKKIGKKLDEIGFQETAGLSAVLGDSWHHLCFASSPQKLFLALGERDSFSLPFTLNSVLESDQVYGQSLELHQQRF